MSDPSRLTPELSDAELIVRVRAGDLDAYGELFARHREAATRLARHLVSGADADDLVAEGFSRVLSALQNEKGPDEFFRAYLLTAIRRLHIDQIRASKRVKTTDDEAELDRAVAFVDPAEMKFEQSTAAAAFASLPERWQLVLWHLDVEGHKPAQVAPLLGMSANSVSALAYRAREGLRAAYLQGHLAPPLNEGCRRTTPQLAQHVRNTLSKRDAAQVDAHLDTCARCSGLYAELSEVNNHLAGLLAPALLGTAAAGYLASSGPVAAVGLFAQLGDTFTRPFRAATAGTSTGVVAAAATVLAVAVAAGGVAISNRSGDDNRAPVQREAVAAPASPAPPAATDEIQSEGNEPESEAAELPTDPIAAPPAPPPQPAAPAPDVTPTPTTEPTTKPTRASPTPRPTPTVKPSPLPAPAPTPTPEGPTATHFTSAVDFVNEPGQQLQRRVTVDIGAVGEEPRGNIITVVMTFNALVNGVVQPNGIVYRGDPVIDWVCDSPASDAPLTTMTCTRTQAGAVIPPIRYSLHGLNPGVRVSVTATDNVDDAAADTTVRACSYGDPSVCPPY